MKKIMIVLIISFICLALLGCERGYNVGVREGYRAKKQCDSPRGIKHRQTQRFKEWSKGFDYGWEKARKENE